MTSRVCSTRKRDVRANGKIATSRPSSARAASTRGLRPGAPYFQQVSAHSQDVKIEPLSDLESRPSHSARRALSSCKLAHSTTRSNYSLLFGQLIKVHFGGHPIFDVIHVPGRRQPAHSQTLESRQAD